MKVLQVNITCGIGSTGRIAVDIGEVLNKNNDENFIAYGYYNSKLPNTMKLKLGDTKYSCYVELLKTRLTGAHGFTSKLATRKLIKWIKEINPDLIHLHNLHSGYLHLGVLFEYLKNAGIPIVWTLHDCWSFTGHCTHFSIHKCEKWKNACYKCPDKTGYPKRWFFDRSKKQWEKKKELFTNVPNMILVTPSYWLADLVKMSYLKDYPVKTINNGIDMNVFKPIKNNIRERYGLMGKRIVLAVANTWSERKGYRYVLEIADKLNGNYQVIIVGLNKKQKETLPKNIIGITKTNNVTELVEFYSAADVFINPTLEDNFPTTNLESLACGTPVITFNTGGSIECVSEHTGMIVKQGDVNALIISIYDVVENKNIDSNLCRNRALELYDKYDRYQDYYNLYYTRLEL